MADFKEIVDILTEKLGADTFKAQEEERFPYLLIPADKLIETCQLLKDDERLAFNFLRCQSALDLPPKSLGMVYHLVSLTLRHNVVLRVEVEREKPIIPTVYGVWKAAEWLEREAYDLMGIEFTDHPDLRRLMLPDDWEGHPLRKDWVDPPTIYNIPTQRVSNLEIAAKEGA